MSELAPLPPQPPGCRPSFLVPSDAELVLPSKSDAPASGSAGGARQAEAQAARIRWLRQAEAQAARGRRRMLVLS